MARANLTKSKMGSKTSKLTRGKTITASKKGFAGTRATKQGVTRGMTRSKKLTIA